MKSMWPPLVVIFLPSAMKLRRLCFYRCVSVHRGEGVVSQHALQVVFQHALQQVSRGVVSQHALQVVSQHALQQVSGRVSAPGGACSRGGLLPGGSATRVVWRPPKSRQLLLWTLHILLECILVMTYLYRAREAMAPLALPGSATDWESAK